MFIVYKAEKGIVTELFVYDKFNSGVVTKSTELHCLPSNAYPPIRDDNACGWWRSFRVVYNKHIDVARWCHMEESDLLALKQHVVIGKGRVKCS